MRVLLLGILGALGMAAQEARAPATEPAGTIEGFRYQAGKLPVGRVYRYRKSNLDGSNPSEIALYLASETRLESLKWHPGEPEATLVVAEMDWSTGSVRSFRNFHVDADGERTLAAAIDTSPDGGSVIGTLGDQRLECRIRRFPWHSYDFDFASLNAALPFLTDPEGETRFDVLDPTYVDGKPALVVRGEAFLAYEGSEEHLGVACRRYAIDGPGLEERGGSLWAAAGAEPHLVAFEIDLPDEPGMRSGRLEWQASETRAPDEWSAFVLARTPVAR